MILSYYVDLKIIDTQAGWRLVEETVLAASIPYDRDKKMEHCKLIPYFVKIKRNDKTEKS